MKRSSLLLYWHFDISVCVISKKLIILFDWILIARHRHSWAQLREAILCYFWRQKLISWKSDKVGSWSTLGRNSLVIQFYRIYCRQTFQSLEVLVDCGFRALHNSNGMLSCRRQYLSELDNASQWSAVLRRVVGSTIAPSTTCTIEKGFWLCSLSFLRAVLNYVNQKPGAVSKSIAEAGALENHVLNVLDH